MPFYFDRSARHDREFPEEEEVERSRANRQEGGQPQPMRRKSIRLPAFMRIKTVHYQKIRMHAEGPQGFIGNCIIRDCPYAGLSFVGIVTPVFEPLRVYGRTRRHKRGRVGPVPFFVGLDVGPLPPPPPSPGSGHVPRVPYVVCNDLVGYRNVGADHYTKFLHVGRCYMQHRYWSRPMENCSLEEGSPYGGRNGSVADNGSRAGHSESGVNDTATIKTPCKHAYTKVPLYAEGLGRPEFVGNGIMRYCPATGLSFVGIVTPVFEPLYAYGPTDQKEGSAELRLPFSSDLAVGPPPPSPGSGQVSQVPYAARDDVVGYRKVYADHPLGFVHVGRCYMQQRYWSIPMENTNKEEGSPTEA